MNKRTTSLILIAGTLAGMSCSAAFAQLSGKETVQQLVTLFSAWSDGRGRRSIFEEAAQHIDYPTMAEMSFTPAQWDAFSPAQKRDMINSFRSLVENRYYRRWHKLFLRSRLTVANEAKAGGDIYVKTFVTQGKDEDTVIWRLRPHNGEPMVVSLNVNGKDLISRLSDRFQKQLKKRGTQGLVAWIKTEAEDRKADDEEDAAASRRAAAK